MRCPALASSDMGCDVSRINSSIELPALTGEKQLGMKPEVGTTHYQDYPVGSQGRSG
jgi:hypothetical protein